MQRILSYSDFQRILEIICVDIIYCWLVFTILFITYYIFKTYYCYLKYFDFYIF